MAVEIPLFPLNAVLFPHALMALHIFEERYRTMMRDCREQGTTFGVIAIREGREVGAGARPYSVGTLAQLRDVEELPDGRYDIELVGASRFRVDAFSRRRQYLTGEVSYLEDAAVTPAGQALAARVTDAYRDYMEAMRAMTKDAAAPAELHEEPELLSYLVAAALQVPVADRQRLLELDSVDARLRACLTMLRREVVLLDHMLGRSVAASPSVPLN